MDPDQISESRIELLHPAIRQDVKDSIFILAERNIKIRIVQGLRTFEEQNSLYAQGRTLPGNIVTNAKGGESYHNYGLAIDFCIVEADGSISWDMNEKDSSGDIIPIWKQVTDLFGMKGFNWGGYWKFKDNPHLEKTFGFSFIQLQQKISAGRVDQNKYVLLT
jgi:peptidoglycan LD-endopeptidase CwlK